jgi:uncharacterized membrane protein YedE/YeeE
MYREDPIEGQPVRKNLVARVPLTIKARHLVYAQLIVAILSVLIGGCEGWGYTEILETGICGSFIEPVVGVIAVSALVFPYLVIAKSTIESPRERRSWLVLHLSLTLSFVQIFAILPSFPD